ncbi:MAG: DUF445 family protein [Tissierellia bacterium]|nr:DUF445 family protein [Tissierellia bacterium]
MEFLIPIVVGAVIGYITNWLAIKMLFRPHYEKRFLGMKVPFTPGLIPKEKSRIAKSVGNTVSEYLLSPEIIIKSVFKNGNDEKFKKWIEYNINKLKESNKSIKNLFIGIIGEERFNSLSNTIEEGITNFINSGIEDWKLKEDKNKLSIDNIDELEGDKETLEEIIPDDIIIGIKNYIQDHDQEIVHEIRNLFKEPSVQLKIKESIERIVTKNVSKLITTFISVEIITDRIFKAMEDYIYNPRINEDTISIITIAIDKVLEKEISKQKLYGSISLIVNKNVEKFINKPIYSIIGNIDETKVNRITDFSKTIFKTFTINKLPYIVELLNISKVIEDEINEFDVAFAEDIIIEIANKELKAITWFGALLGGIMGILMPFLTMISVKY